MFSKKQFSVIGLIFLATTNLIGQEYKVDFPCKPEAEIITTHHEEFGTLVRYVDLCGEDYPNLGYSFSRTTYNEGDVNTDDFDTAIVLLLETMNNSADNVSGKLLTNFIENFKGIPSIRYKVSIRDGKYIIANRLLLIDDTIYHLSVSMKSEFVFNEKSIKFLNSFHLGY